MATNGNVAKLTLNSKIANQEMSSDFGIKTAMIDITSKASAGFKEVMAGLKEFSLSMECVFEKIPASPTQTYASDIVGWQIAGTLVPFVWQPSVTAGDIKFSGNLYISDCSFKSANDDKITYSVTFQITGAVTVGTV